MGEGGVLRMKEKGTAGGGEDTEDGGEGTEGGGEGHLGWRRGYGR